MKYLSIEGLRGVLAVMVCFGHYGLGQLFEKVGLQFNLHFAVDLFFVISGFVLAHSNYFSNKPITAATFALKRFARLYPLHLITLLIMCVLNVMLAVELSPTVISQQLLLAHNVGLSTVDNSLNFPSWSISVEFWGSIFFFMLIAMVKHKGVLLGLCSVLLLFFSLNHSAILMNGDYEGMAGFINSGLMRALVGIGLGVVIYLTTSIKSLKTVLEQKLIGYCSLLGLVSFFIFKLSDQFACLFYLLTYGLISHMTLQLDFLKILSTRLFVGLGAISYAIYLLHIPLYKMVQWQWGDAAVKGWAGKLFLLPILFILAVITYRSFERPLQRAILSLRFKWLPA